MREQTLYQHLAITEDCLCQERIRLDRQMGLFNRLKAQGSDLSNVKTDLLVTKNKLLSLEHHRQRLLEQLGLVVPSGSPTHLRRFGLKRRDV